MMVVAAGIQMLSRFLSIPFVPSVSHILANVYSLDFLFIGAELGYSEDYRAAEKARIKHEAEEALRIKRVCVFLFLLFFFLFYNYLYFIPAVLMVLVVVYAG